MTLLYIGAGWDAHPITRQHIREDHDLIVYVDALPKLPYYSGLCITEEGIMDDLKPDGGRVFVDQPRKDAGSWTVALENDVTLRYFFNVKDVEISQNEALAALLPSVVTMWCAGFAPDHSVFDHIPC